MVEVIKRETVIPERTEVHHEIHLDWYDEFSDVLSFAKSRCLYEEYSDGDRTTKIVNVVYGFHLTEEQLDDFGGIHGKELHDMLKRIEWLIIISKMRRPSHALPLVKHQGEQIEHWRIDPVFHALANWITMDVDLKLSIASVKAMLDDDSMFVFQSRWPWRVKRSDDMRTYSLDVRFGFGFVPSLEQVPRKEITPFSLSYYKDR